MHQELQEKGALAQEAAYVLADMTTAAKNAALLAMAAALEDNLAPILAANAKDMAIAGEKGMPAAFLDRLMLNEKRIYDMAAGLRATAELADPIGTIDSGWQGAQEIAIRRVRVPLGVIGIIYEARPNVTADAAALCLKSGNAVILRGSKDAFNSNLAITQILSAAAVASGMPRGAIQLIEDTGRECVNELMKLNQYIDVLIPRGGAGLIKNVVENSTVPVIQTGVGNCHAYVDAAADLDMALEIIYNGKVQRPAVCNSLETVLVHEKIAAEFLPKLAAKLSMVEIRACSKAKMYLPEATTATEDDYAGEFGALILALKVVADIDEAISHIRRYSTKHSEVIITNDYLQAQRFSRRVDAACVYVNASTRFSDGFQFGFGAEIGISTQKLHARGPMGLAELTGYKYIVEGNGQVRQ